jgi:CHAT domain-containing protein
MIYGGVRFEMDSTAIANANIAQNVSAQDTTGGLFGYANRPVERGGALEYLPGTEREALFLQGLLQKQQIPVILRLGYSATEESFKQIGRPLSPSLLHIGTHGFFFPDPKDTTHRRTIIGEDAPAFKISEHPLIRSGLMLAGSRYAWENKHPMHGMEDGILTAYEVSQMNLSNTDLVVLSACETGLGDIRGNEGVYGLQRAFRIAGAKNVLMSLWKVNDEVTEKLLTRFYQNWLEGKMPVREAFEAAQKWMREFRNKEGLEIYRNPYFWAGFVLIGQ